MHPCLAVAVAVARHGLGAETIDITTTARTVTA
jgi:hypothetical protein